jgi:hypothetical protein
MGRTMLYPIKPGCFKPRTDGAGNIHIQYCYTPEKEILIDTEIVIRVNCWDKENLVITPDLPRQFGAAKNLNDAIAAQLGKLFNHNNSINQLVILARL